MGLSLEPKQPISLFVVLLLSIQHQAMTLEETDNTSPTSAILEQLQVCGGDTVVVVMVDAVRTQHPSEGVIHQQEVMRYLSSLSIPYVSLVMENSTDTLQIQRIAFNRTPNNGNCKVAFLLMTSYPAEILAEVELSFHNDLEKRGSLFPHESRWIIFATSPSQKSSVIGQQRRDSVLDNVAVVYYSDYSKPTLQISTFMWRDNRTKELVEIPVHRNSRATCELFPNLQFGLNARQLTVVLHSANHSVKDQFITFTNNYSISVMDVLAKTLNFTYTVTTASKWRGVEEILTSGRADIAPDLWFYDGQSGKPSVTYSQPVVFDTYTGIYRRPVVVVEKAVLMIFPFRSQVIFLILGSFVYCIYFYILLVLSHSSSSKIGADNQAGLASSFPSGAMPFPCRVGYKILTITNSLIFSIVGQPSFPKPTKTSQRIILFVLSFSTVIFYALYTGVLTASITITPNERPIMTFEDMLTSRRDYTCTIMDDGGLPYFVEKARTGLTKRVKDSCTVTKNPGLTLDGLIRIFNSLEPNTVLIFYGSALKEVRKLANHPEDVMVIREALRNANQGFLFPLGSELEPLISLEIQRLHAMDLLNVIYYNSFKGRDTVTAIQEVKGHRKVKDKDDCQMHLDEFKWLAAVTSILTCLSFLALVVEWTVTWYRYRQLKRA